MHLLLSRLLQPYGIIVVDSARDGGRPTLEVRTHVRWHTQQLTDNGDGERKSERLNQVDGRVRADRVQ